MTYFCKRRKAKAKAKAEKKKRMEARTRDPTWARGLGHIPEEAGEEGELDLIGWDEIVQHNTREDLWSWSMALCMT